MDGHPFESEQIEEKDMGSTDIDTGLLVEAAVAALDESAIRSLSVFRDEGAPEQIGTAVDMIQIMLCVVPQVCLIGDQGFECAADMFWNWGAYSTESFATVVGSVVDGRAFVGSIQIFSSQN
jgi:hypothetical protein